MQCVCVLIDASSWVWLSGALMMWCEVSPTRRDLIIMHMRHPNLMQTFSHYLHEVGQAAIPAALSHFTVCNTEKLGGTWGWATTSSMCMSHMLITISCHDLHVVTTRVQSTNEQQITSVIVVVQLLS